MKKLLYIGLSILFISAVFLSVFGISKNKIEPISFFDASALENINGESPDFGDIAHIEDYITYNPSGQDPYYIPRELIMQKAPAAENTVLSVPCIGLPSRFADITMQTMNGYCVGMHSFTTAYTSITYMKTLGSVLTGNRL